MNPFDVPSYDSVSDDAKPAFDRFIKLLGKMPNLYAVIGNSATTLNAYVAYTQAQVKGKFHAKDREAIYLIVSQLNGCEYCLASHTASALKNGWTEEETLLIRAGKFPDAKWTTLYQMIRSVIDHKGEVSDELLSAFYQLGYTQEALMDLMALISIMSFTNYVYRLTKVPIDYPMAKAI